MIQGFLEENLIDIRLKITFKIHLWLLDLMLKNWLIKFAEVGNLIKSFNDKDSCVTKIYTKNISSYSINNDLNSI